MTRSVGIIALFSVLASWARADTATQIILTKRAAVTISPVRLYADSTYKSGTETTFTEGELFEIIGESMREAFDNTQNQTFKWFKVRAVSSGATGWLFGDNLAVVLPEYVVDAPLRPFFKKSAAFDNGFEKATTWVAGTEGHDAKSATNPFLNPSYKEFYLVVTNERGRSVVLNYANVNESGIKNVQSVYFQDVTDNKIPEIILETSSLPSGQTLEERSLEVYSFRGGALVKIFEEPLSLAWEADVPSPSVAKFVEIEGATVRVAYVDFVGCAKSLLNLPTDSRSPTQERCLEYVTYSFSWDKAARAFRQLYKPTRRSLQAAVVGATTLKTDPSVESADVALVSPDDRLQIIKHFQKIVIENGQKQVETWVYARHPSGALGYLRADKVTFKNIEHAAILEAFYQKTPLLMQDWHVETPFVKIIK